MNASTNCPNCGIQLLADAPAGLCPKCLVKVGLENPQPVLSGIASTMKSPASSGFVPPSVEELTGRFPQLEILELLGKGGMGAVYKARQRGLDRLVAVKILPPEISDDPGFVERFTREARALARLSHNHIVSVYDCGQLHDGRRGSPPGPLKSTEGREVRSETEETFERANGSVGDRTQKAFGDHHERGLCYIVMEYVDGVNLRQVIQSGNISPGDALAIVSQVCEALQFAHDEGIVHRDIKPENILIDKRGRVKIADFGLSKLLGADASDYSLTAAHQVMGTLRYMAPEQMQGSREVDHRADIYSLGVVFYELLTGELPMGRFAPPSRKVRIDIRLDEIVLRTLEQEPEQRYQQASQVKSDVEIISRPQSTGGIASEKGHVMPAHSDFSSYKETTCSMPLVSNTSDSQGSSVPVHSTKGSSRDGIGRISLWTGITGVVVPVLIAVGTHLFVPSHLASGAFFFCALLGITSELAAIICGVVAWRTRSGKAGCLIASSALITGLLIISLPVFPDDLHETASSIELTSTPLPPHQQEPSSEWIMGSDGPALGDTFARAALQLTPAQIEQFNSILRTVYAEFPAVEAQHTERHIDDAGHLVVRINPLPETVIAPLEDRLWSQLDSILNPQQQSIARLNLNLDPPKIQPPIAVHELVRPGFFGWGRNGAFLEMWRVGTWYHWRIQTRGFEESSNAPQLPDQYRRYWKEPDSLN